jgi:hypothetical protein
LLIARKCLLTLRGSIPGWCASKETKSALAFASRFVSRALVRSRRQTLKPGGVRLVPISGTVVLLTDNQCLIGSRGVSHRRPISELGGVPITSFEIDIKKSWEYDNQSASQLSSPWQPLQPALEHPPPSPRPPIHPAHGQGHPRVVARHDSSHTETFQLGRTHGGNGSALVKGRQPSSVLACQFHRALSAVHPPPAAGRAGSTG